MPFYMTQASYTAEAWKALVANPQDRAEATRKRLEGSGCKLVHFFFAFGDYDVVTIMEAPDNVAVSSQILGSIAGGSMSGVKTTVLMTPGEVVEALKGASKVVYRPPGS